MAGTRFASVSMDHRKETTPRDKTDKQNEPLLKIIKRNMQLIQSCVKMHLNVLVLLTGLHKFKKHCKLNFTVELELCFMYSTENNPSCNS